MNVHITPKSSNRKTGPIPVTTTTADSCPDACPLKDNGCYGDGGPLLLHWRKVSNDERGGSWPDLCSFVRNLEAGTLWRHNQVGDLPGNGNRIDRKALESLVFANNGRKGFTYTHKPVYDGQKNVDGSKINSRTIRSNRHNVAIATAAIGTTWQSLTVWALP
jgi:hypothetical protein